MAWVCKLCIMQHGLKGSDLGEWPESFDEAWFAEHMGREHGVVVLLPGETDEAALLRVAKLQGGD